MPFRVSVNLPFDQINRPNEFLSLQAVREIAGVAEQAGFDAGAVTDHPVPSYRWLDSGGHYAQDPFVLLALIAASTERLSLQTGILVLPYRNPFLTARAVSTLDVFSGGRVILGIGAGYLKAEYKALGVDFDSRNELMDEYIRAMKAAWTGDDFTFEGTGYTAVGNRLRPVPVQKPHPPLLIGGNSKRAIRRAVELGDAWNPVLLDAQVTQTSRTGPLANEDDLRALIGYMHDHCEKVDRASPPAVIISSGLRLSKGYNAQEALETLAHLRGMGLAGCAVGVNADTRGEWCELVHQFGEDVLSNFDKNL